MDNISDMLNGLSEEQRSVYWWNYGEIGQKLVENSEYILSLLKKNYKIMDGHKIVKNRFSNLPEFRHLDIVIYDSKKKLVKGICEVKTTKNKFKNEFESNGACARVMEEAKRNGIPLFFAVVRLNDLLPTKIITDKGLAETLEKLKKDSSFYKIEFYTKDKFKLEDGIFKTLTS